MSSMRPPSAKIIQHAAGMGIPDPTLVRQRAQELARINGHAEYTEQDWAEAKRELHGGHELNDTNGEMEISKVISERDMVSTSIGHHVENMAAEDNENVVEELIAEGMDEALHEQMLASRVEDAAGDEEE